jgi:hypothetical protein
MVWFKDAVAKGIFYSSIGITDYDSWSKKILEDFGTELIPYIRDLRKWSLVLRNSAQGNRSKLNCWEFMGCGLHTRRSCLKLFHAGPCPASTETHLDGIHGGRNAGRACWVVLHTRCYGTVQNTHEQKYGTCTHCDFYKSVTEEEDVDFLSSYTLGSQTGNKKENGL